MTPRNDIYLAPKERFPEDDLAEMDALLEKEMADNDEMDRADERAERMATRWNGGAQ